MRKTLCIFLCNLLIICHLSSLAQEQMYSQKDIQKDIIFLKSQLEIFHPNLYKYTTKERLDFVCDSLIKNAPSDANLRKAFGHFMPLLHEIKCGHTKLIPDERLIYQTLSIGNPHFFPFDIYIKNGRLFITKSYVKITENVFNSGDEILKINNIPTKDVLNALYSYNFGYSDGDSPNATDYFLQKYFKFLIRIWLGSQAKFYLEVKRQKVDFIENYVVTARILNIFEPIEESKTVSNRATPYYFQYTILDSLKSTAIILVNSFMDNKGWFSNFDEESFQLMKYLNKRKIKNIIIDLRGNLGGQLSYSINLLSMLIKNPILSPRIKLTQTAINRINSEKDLINLKSYSKYDSLQLVSPNPKIRFEGNTYILIDGGTSSAAAFFASKLYDTGIGTFVGTPVGGAYDGSSAGWFTDSMLPATKLKVSIPLAKIDNNMTIKNYPNNHLKPDFEVQDSFEDFANSRDAVLEYTINLIKQGKKAR